MTYVRANNLTVCPARIPFLEKSLIKHRFCKEPVQGNGFCKEHQYMQSLLDKLDSIGYAGLDLHDESRDGGDREAWERIVFHCAPPGTWHEELFSPVTLNRFKREKRPAMYERILTAIEKHKQDARRNAA